MQKIRVSYIPLLAALSGCALFGTEADSSRPDAYDRYVEANNSVEESESLVTARERGKAGVRFSDTPSARELKAQGGPAETYTPGGYSGETVEVNFNGIPLPAFINEVYGNLLGESFMLDSTLASAKDLVTLRAVGPQTPDQLASIAGEVMNQYGVGISREGDILRFYPSAGRGSDRPPLLVSGRTLPDVPISHRTIFQFAPLKVVRNANATNWLKQIFAGKNLQVFDDLERNSLLLKGTPELVNYALETIQTLDQPLLRGKYSLRISPFYVDAATLANKLVEVLQSEGYSASIRPPTGSIIVLPIPQAESVIAFAADRGILDHIKEWVTELDRPSNNKNEAVLLYYQVRNTKAEDLAQDIEKLMPAIRSISGEAASGEGGGRRVSRQFGGSKVVVDKNRNGLILNMTGGEWEKLRPILEKMDRPARLVLIEVTLASVTLTDSFATGIDWIEVSSSLGKYDISWSAPLGLDGGNLTARVLNNAGDVKAILALFNQDQRVTIMSRPHIMVKSGAAATMDVGTEIPVVTSAVSAADIPGSSVNRNIQYRKTGLLLSVAPTVHSGDRVDLEITQVVSEALASESAENPSIFSRTVTTNLTLGNGGSVIIGGLISESETSSQTSIPVLGSLPGVGRLFRSDNRETVRNELLILIQAYVVGDDGQARGVTEALKERFGEAAQMLQ